MGRSWEACSLESLREDAKEMKKAFGDEVKERERRRHFGVFLVSWPRQEEEWYFMQFNTLKRRDDLLLFKNGMHHPLLCY